MGKRLRKFHRDGVTSNHPAPRESALSVCSPAPGARLGTGVGTRGTCQTENFTPGLRKPLHGHSSKRKDPHVQRRQRPEAGPDLASGYRIGFPAFAISEPSIIPNVLSVLPPPTPSSQKAQAWPIVFPITSPATRPGPAARKVFIGEISKACALGPLTWRCSKFQSGTETSGDRGVCMVWQWEKPCMGSQRRWG